MSAPFAVLFDMDGVIFDSERAIRQIWRELGSELGLDGIDAVFARCIGTNKARTAEIFSDTWPELPFRRFDDLARARFLERYGEGRLPMKAGAREILSALRERGVPLALASSTSSGSVRRELGEAGLLPCFDALICGDQVTRSKPDPEIFLLAAEALDRAPRDCFVIEDSYNGIRAAHAAGMRALMVPDLVEPDGEMREKAEAVLPDLAAAQRYLLQRIG